MPASVSPVSGNLGNKETTAVTPYVVSPQSGTTITQIVERINGVITNTITNPASLSRTLTAPQATWDTLAYFGTHTASVTVTDSGGGQAVVTYTFVKRLATSASLLEATKANADAKNRISQKRDALAAQVGLSAGSTFDAILGAFGSNVTKKQVGTVISSSAKESFTLGNTSTQTAFSVTVNTLTFKPTHIIVFLPGTLSVTTYAEDLNGSHANDVDNGNDIAVVANSPNTSLCFRNTGNAYVNATGFKLPVGGDFVGSQQYKYLAFG